MVTVAENISISEKITTRPPRAKVLCVPKQYATVLEAVTAANDGDCIALSSGVHELTEPLRIDKDVHIIVGDEGSMGVTLLLDTTKGGLLRVATHMIVIDCSTCRMANLTIEHRGDNAAIKERPELIFTIWCTRGSAILDQCTILSDMHSAIGVGSGAYPTLRRCQISSIEYGNWISHQGKLRLERCVVNAAKGSYHQEGSSCEVDACHFVNCGVGMVCEVPCDVVASNTRFENSSIHCLGARNDLSRPLEIHTNEFEGAGTEGILIDGARPVIRKNAFRNCLVKVKGGGQGQLLDNTFLGMGVVLEDRANPVVRGNHFEGCKEGVVVTERLSQGMITGNTFTRCEVAVKAQAYADPSIVANAIDECDVGTSFLGGSKGSMRGNRVTKCRVGTCVEGGADPLLDQNDFHFCKEAITITGSMSRLVGNRITHTEEASIRLDAATGTIIEDNIIKNSGKEGLLILHASASTILANTITGCALSALQCSEDSKSSVTQQDNIVSQT